MAEKGLIEAPLETLRSPEGRSWDGVPIRRLTRLLAQESSDLWALVVYSTGIGLLTVVVPVTVQSLVNTVAFGALMQPLLVLTLLVMGALSFSALINALRVWVVEILQRRLFVRVALDTTARLLKVRAEAFDRLHGPELVNRFFDVVTVQKAAALLLIDGLSLLMQTLVGLILLAVYHPLLLAFDVLLIVVMLLVMFVLGRGAIKTAIYESKVKYKMAEWLEELASHPTAFKSTSGARFAMAHSDHIANQYLDHRSAHFRIVFRQNIGSFALQALASSVLLGVGGLLVLDRQLTLGQLVAAELIVTSVAGGFAKFGKKFETYYDLLASLDKLGQLIDLPLERNGRPVDASGGPAPVELHDVSLGYPEQPDLAAGATIRIAAGERIAVSGPSGSGKTTLLQVIAGMREPLSGVLMVDGVDYRLYEPISLREQIVLCHSGDTFHGTVLENIAMGRPGIGVHEVTDALRAVGLLEEVLALEKGLDTPLTTNGRPLSPSEESRLVLARAIAGRPRVLVLDEAIDKIENREMRDRIAATLFGPDAPWTLVCATRHSDLIARCSRELRIEDGKVYENRLKEAS